MIPARHRRASRSVLLLAVLGLALTAGGCDRGPADGVMSGYAEADLVYVSAPTSGLLETLSVQRGDTVRRGQMLFEQELRAEVLGTEAAAAREARAAAQVANLRKGRRPVEIAAIDAQLAQARAALSASTAQLDRQRSLVDQGFVAPLRLDELQAQRDRDAARIRELQAQRDLALTAARSDEVAAALADVRGSQADRELAEWRQAQRSRAAPQDAQVFDVLARPGEWVAAGTPVLALLPAGALKVRFFVPQAALSRVAVGARVSLACDGCAPGLSGRVSWIAPRAEYTPPVIYSNASRSKLVFMVEAVPDDGPRAALKPGQPVDVTLPPPARTS